MGLYLVTGAAGFIASRVSAMLLEQGHRVVGVDDLSDAYDVRLKNWRLDQLKTHPEFVFCQTDIRSKEQLSRVWANLAPFDAVINLAARAGVRYSIVDPWVYFETNVTGTLNLLELCREYDVKKFVIASSSSLYGDDNEVPYREDSNTDHPISSYAASKKAAETLCYTYNKLYDIDMTVFRYFTVYGPAGRPDMSIFRFIKWISEDHPLTVYGDGQQSRDFTYVDDIARGTIAGLKPLGYEVINLGSDRPIVLMDVIHAIEKVVGKSAELIHHPFHPADVKATWADVSKAKRLLSWQAEFSFEDGVAQTVAWYQKHKDWLIDIETG